MSRSLVRGLLLGAAGLLLRSSHAASQAGPRQAAGTAVASTPIDASRLKGLKWRNIGPSSMSGRIADFAVARSPGLPDALYVAAAIGGVWKTTDWGTTWDPVFDSANGMSSIGDVTVAPSNPNLVWVGTSEARQAAIDGVYAMQKSRVAAQNAIRPLAEQLMALRKQLTGATTIGGSATATPVTAELQGRVAAVADSLPAVERLVNRDLGAVNQLAGAIGGFTGAPTPIQARAIAWAHEDLTASLTRLNSLLQKEIPELFSALQAQHFWPGTICAIALPPRGTP